MAESSSKGPFYAKDSNGTLQKIKVVDLSGSLPDTSDDLIAGYAYVEATGSTYDSISGSYENLIIVNDKLDNLTSSVDSLSVAVGGISTVLPDMLDGMNHVTASVDNNTKFVEQILRFQRATHLYSKRFIDTDLFDESEDGIEIPIHMLEELNPAGNELDREDFMAKAIEVIIQNSTNKNLYLKISYDPGSPLSITDYTVKIPPGIIYTSDSKVAHIRHKMKFKDGDPSEGFVGEVVVSIAYNTSLNNDLSIGQTTPGDPSIISLTTNHYYMTFDSNRKLISEWSYVSGTNTNEYISMTISGQARITYPDAPYGQKLILYVTKDNETTPYGGISKKVFIVDETPTAFSLNYSGPDAPETGRYNLMAELEGTGDIGDARILFADLIKRKVVTP